MNRFSRSMSKEKAIEFIRGMYTAAGFTVPSEEQAIGEWTDRSNCVRSRYSNGAVVVFTHGISAAFDGLPLPVAVLESLTDYDLRDRNIKLSSQGESQS
jgi:hypothetical protein